MLAGRNNPPPPSAPWKGSREQLLPLVRGNSSISKGVFLGEATDVRGDYCPYHPQEPVPQIAPQVSVGPHFTRGTHVPPEWNLRSKSPGWSQDREKSQSSASTVLGYTATGTQSRKEGGEPWAHGRLGTPEKTPK